MCTTGHGSAASTLNSYELSVQCKRSAEHTARLALPSLDNRRRTSLITYAHVPCVTDACRTFRRLDGDFFLGALRFAPPPSSSYSLQQYGIHTCASATMYRVTERSRVRVQPTRSHAQACFRELLV
jgi:hypothetical protein